MLMPVSDASSIRADGSFFGLIRSVRRVGFATVVALSAFVALGFSRSVVRVWTSKVSNAGLGPRARIFQRDEVEVCIGRRRRTASSVAVCLLSGWFPLRTS